MNICLKTRSDDIVLSPVTELALKALDSTGA